ncbi:MAG: hypothetical protein M5U26_13795 [Planctomycetota bacterium]|nr:hypothetical protein [Planctomycetota bacterium]
MTAEEALQRRQPYLDGELSAGERAEVEACLAADPALREAFEAEAAFHAFLKRASAHVEAPEGLVTRLAGKLWPPEPEARPFAHPAAAPLPPRRRAFRLPAAVSSLGMAAAVMLVLAGMTFGVARFQIAHECPYIELCQQTHARILGGGIPMALRSADASKLVKYVNTRSEMNLERLPDLLEFNLEAAGAGTVSFRAIEGPNATFVRYNGCTTGDACLSLIVHNWPEEYPDPMNFDQRTGFWIVEHPDYRLISWKGYENGPLYSLVSRRPLSEMLKIAELARAQAK